MSNFRLKLYCIRCNVRNEAVYMEHPCGMAVVGSTAKGNPEGAKPRGNERVATQGIKHLNNKIFTPHQKFLTCSKESCYDALIILRIESYSLFRG